jgi:hypothetical protein
MIPGVRGRIGVTGGGGVGGLDECCCMSGGRTAKSEPRRRSRTARLRVTAISQNPGSPHLSFHFSADNKDGIIVLLLHDEGLKFSDETREGQKH